MGIKIATYRGNNGVYKSVAFQQELKRCHQNMSFSGVDTHEQSTVTELVIQKVTYSARTMMLHRGLLWPEWFQEND